MVCADCTCGRANGEQQPAPTRTVWSYTAGTAPWQEGIADRLGDGKSNAIPLRSKEWFNNSHNPGMTALYLERYVNGGTTLPELASPSRPVIGIAQTGSDLSPCNSHHKILAQRVREGIIANGGTAIEFPVHPIQETGRRPTACLDRNLAYLGLVELLHGYPLDGVVLLSGCDKTTPALLMAAATVNIPSIVLNVGPMLNGYSPTGKREGSGTLIWEHRQMLSAGLIDYTQFLHEVGTSAPSVGHCNSLGTASTMNCLAEALGMALPGSAIIPAAYRERSACAYATGFRAVSMVREDLKPSDILTREAFENAIAVNTVIGGSTNAPIHLNAIAKHAGVELSTGDWEACGYELPLLVNVQPAGEYLCEEFFRAGGVPAVVHELLKADKLPHPSAITINGKTIKENCDGQTSMDARVIHPFEKPLKQQAGFLNLSGSLFDSAIMKTSVIDDAFRKDFLSSPTDPMAFEGPVAVFDGPEDYHARIDLNDGSITAGTILVMRGTGPVGYPGAAEVVNMLPPSGLVRSGVTQLPCIGDGRQSGTSGSPSILNASPEAATGGMLGYLKDGDRVRIDLLKRRADVLLSAKEIDERKQEMGKYPFPASQTPWQEIFRDLTGELSEGMVLKNAVKYQRVAQGGGAIPRDNH